MRLASWVFAAAAGSVVGCEDADAETSAHLTRERPSPSARNGDDERPRQPRCASDMVWVRGEYCPEPRQRCRKHLIGKGSLAAPPCVSYDREVGCRGERRALSFCIDRDEHRAPGSDLPQNQVSFSEARKICAGEGKRLCSFSEWVLSCEGEELRPFPYGFTEREPACHAFATDLKTERGKLADRREPVGSRTQCVSAFAVRDLVGNVQEHVIYETARFGSALMGGYWQPNHAGCRDAQTAHDRHYRGVETGFRCCSDVGDPAP